MRNEFYARNSNAIRCGTESISFFSQKIWASEPQNIKDSSSLPYLEKSIRKWKPSCSCRLCKTFLQHVGFM